MNYRLTGSPLRRARSAWIVPAALAVLLVAPPLVALETAAAAAAATTEAPARGAGQFVAGVGDRVIGVLQSHPSKSERAQALESIFQKAFDVNGMAQFAAGLYWRRTDPAERQKYVKLFGDYVANLYAVKFADYQGQKFTVTGQRPAGDGVIAVETAIVSSDKKTPIEFRVRKEGNDFRIVDVYVAGVSMLITKRDEFSTVLAHEGMQGLMQRLKATASG